MNLTNIITKQNIEPGSPTESPKSLLKNSLTLSPTKINKMKKLEKNPFTIPERHYDEDYNKLTAK